MINRCESEADYKKILTRSNQRLVFLFKHSTRCQVSSDARIQFEQFSNLVNSADFWQVFVVENRTLSLQIASVSGIEHQSPQVLLFIGGKAARSCSHREISVDSLTQMLNESATL